MSEPPTILIVDDDAAIRRLIATILRAESYVFRDAADVSTALVEVDDTCPQLVILDVNVPGDGGGLGVLSHIRADPALAGVRVLLVSGVAQAYEQGWGISLGADGHLAKPFELEDLRSAVHEILSLP